MKKKITAYNIILLIFAAVSFFVMLQSQLPLKSPTTQLIIGLEAFFILTLLVEIFSIPLLSSQSTVSVVPPVIWSMFVLFGPLYATIIAVVSNFIYDFQVKKIDYRMIITNTAQQLTSVSLAGMTFLWTGGTVGQQELSVLIVPFLASVSVYLLLESLFSCISLALTEDISPYEAWAANFRWLLPYELALIPFGMLMIFIYQYLGLAGLLLFMIPLLMIRRSYSLNVDLKKTYKETVQAFIRTIEAHDSYTSGHSIRVANYSKQLAKKIRMPYNDIERLEIAAYLHDIGKIANYFSDKILNNHDKLGEYMEKKKAIHLYQGDRLISGISFLKEVGEIVRHHHERWDGTGYPDGLAGEKIPRSSRVLMIADAFDAMTTDRAYRKAMSISEAVEELKNNAGTQFDPHLVHIFIKKCIKLSEDGFNPKINSIKKIGQKSTAGADEVEADAKEKRKERAEAT